MSCRFSRAIRRPASVYPVTALPLVQEILRGTDYSLQGFVRCAVAAGLVSPHPISTHERLLFRNVNTPADLA